MRESNAGQQRVRTRTQFESNLPHSGQVQPVVVGEEQNNDTIVDDAYEVFNAIVELSGIGKTPEEVLQEIGVQVYTDANGVRKFFANSGEWLEGTGLVHRFLTKYYEGNYAFVKVGDREIYGQVRVERNGQFKMRTSKGVLIMPYVYIQTANGKEECFFPMKALLNGNEQGLFSMYRACSVLADERDQLEKEILSNLVKLTTVNKPQTVIESNKVFSDVEELCRNAGTVKKIDIRDGKLILNFDWRVGTDNSDIENGLVLPPFELLIDLMNGTVRGNGEYHPHIMSDNSLCMGGTLRDLAQRCVAQKDLYTLVSGMIQFGNSRTSEDVSGGSRHPANCIKRYLSDNHEGFDEIRDMPKEIVEKIWHTFNLKFNDYRDFFEELLSE